jgi:type II secretory pathway component GspD/PulD (secretin)
LSLAGIITNNADGDKIGATFDYINTLEESELLSAPRVTTMNRKPAVIADLSTEYFVSQVYTEMIAAQNNMYGGGTASIGYTQQVVPTAFNFGITLSVTPQISGGDQVRLWLNPQVTTRGTEKTFTQKSVISGNEITSEITLPSTSTQAIWTNVIVHDGDTLVLGGLVTDQTIKDRHKMPYLADIPLLGFFFRGKSKSASQSTLLIFVTPTIIDTTGAKFFEAGGAATGASRRTATVKGPGAVEESATPTEAPAEPLAAPEAKAPTEAPTEESAEPPAKTSVEKSEAEKPQLEAPATAATQSTP